MNKEEQHSLTETVVLRKHSMKHLPELQIDDSIFEARFAGSCSMMNCDSSCCQGGVFVDIAERDKILAHAEIIQRYMESHQTKETAGWFEPHEIEDGDFPSGKAIGTEAKEYGCVFLQRSGKCVLQVTATAEGMHKFDLKPVYCVAFPVTVLRSVLMVDDLEFADRRQCCGTVERGGQNIFDVCTEELESILGKEGCRELQHLYDTRTVE